MITTIVTLLAVAGIAAKTIATTVAGKALLDTISLENVGKIQGFDQPYQDAFIQALDMMFKAADYVQKLIVLFAFLFIVLSAIKMMFSAVELKKFFVDALFKCTIVVCLTVIFPSIMEKTFTLATKMGLEISGGQKNVSLAFVRAAELSTKLWEQGTEDYINKLRAGATTDPNADPNAPVFVSKDLVKTLTKNGMSESEAIEWARQKGIYFVDKGSLSTGEKLRSHEIAQSIKYDTNMSEIQKQKKAKQALSIINAMKTVLTGVSNGQLLDGDSMSATQIMNMGQETLKTVFFNPFIEGSDTLLSTSAMVKTAIILSEMISAGYMSAYDDSASDDKIKLSQFTKYNTSFLGWLGTIIKNFVFKVAMILATIIIMIEYALTLIEFFFVMSLSMLLIPLFFLDATKSFATNIMRTVISYFFKILVTTVMIFFVLNMYINACLSVVSNDMTLTIWLFYYLYVIMLGLVLVKSAGRIAGSIVSGNPSLDFGAVAHQMHGMSHAARSGSRMAGQYLNEGKQALQKSGTQVLDAASTFKGMNAAKKSAESTAAGLEGTSLTDKQISSVGNQAARQFQAQKLAQNFKDGLFERLTGQKADKPQDGLMKVGRTYMDSETGVQKFASNGLVKDNSNDLARQMGQDKMQPYVDQAKETARQTSDMNKTGSRSLAKKKKNNESGGDDKPFPDQ